MPGLVESDNWLCSPDMPRLERGFTPLLCIIWLASALCNAFATALVVGLPDNLSRTNSGVNPMHAEVCDIEHQLKCTSFSLSTHPVATQGASLTGHGWDFEKSLMWREALPCRVPQFSIEPRSPHQIDQI